MKRFFKPLLLLFAMGIVIISCKKDKTDSGNATISAIDYTFNKATKSFTPDTGVKADINSASGIRFVYCYLIRSNATDSLIYVSNNTQDNPKTYTVKIPSKVFPVNNISNITGVKILAKQSDNSSVEGFIKVTYFDPALPAFNGFAASINPNLTGGNTPIAGNVTSDFGLKQVDIYDDYKATNSYELVTSITTLNSAKQYALAYNYIYRKASQHIKIVATDIYGQTKELIINMPVDLSAFKPILTNFAATITPNLTGTTAVTGTITSVTGLKRVDIYDDYQGSYVLITSINLNSSLNYSFNYAYTFRRRAANFKLIAVDNDDLQTEKVIPLNITYQSKIYRDVFMTAQTTGTNTIFFIDNGTTLGNCDLNASEPTMSFLYYATSTGPTFYAPTNTSGVASNFKCNGVSWVIANPANLRATRLRVLVPGTTGIDNIYTQYNSGNLDVIDDAFFTANSVSIPAGSTARFDAVAAPTTGIFNTTGAYLIWVRVPDANGTTFKNGLIRAKVATATVGTSTITFDILLQK